MNESSTKLWWKRIVSLIGVIYTAIIGWFSYLSIFYEVEITNKVAFCIVLCVVSLFVLLCMLYTRFQLLTKLCGFLLLPLAFPLIMLCFGEWELIIPIATVSILIFFLTGATEKKKTIFGMIYLLLYIFGSLVYFMADSFFASTVEQTILEEGVSPSGDYRYELVQTDDSSGGDIEIHVEPNDKDISLPLISFTALGYERTVYMERPASTDDLEVEWTVVSREEITEELLSISENLTLDLTDKQKRTLGISEDTETVYLKDLTDDDLALLGVPEENDVLTFRGETCFRTYVAILEDYYSWSNRELTIFE